LIGNTLVKYYSKSCRWWTFSRKLSCVCFFCSTRQSRK